MDSLNQQRYEEHVEEAGWIADSYPRDEEQIASQNWLNAIRETFATQAAKYDELARRTRQPKTCPDCKMSNADRHYDNVNQICSRYSVPVVPISRF